VTEGLRAMARQHHHHGRRHQRRGAICATTFRVVARWTELTWT
jgi:hypothetical protein